MSRWQRLVRWAATALPEPVAAAPERVLINLVCVLVGLAVLVSEQPSALWPAEVSYAWALAMIGGGGAVLVGYWTGYRDPNARWAGSLERVGYLAILLASAAYGVRAIWLFGWRAVPIGAVFLGIAAAKWIRLAVSSEARGQVLRSDSTERD